MESWSLISAGEISWRDEECSKTESVRKPSSGMARGKVFARRTTQLWKVLVTLRWVNKDISIDMFLRKIRDQRQHKLIKHSFWNRNDRRRQSCIPKLGGEFRALLLVLVLLSRPEVWLQSRSRLGIPCRASWKPILLDTAHRYREHHVTIHWKHESGWSVGIGWLISDRACTLLSASGSHNPPRTVSVFKRGCRLSFYFLQSKL